MPISPRPALLLAALLAAPALADIAPENVVLVVNGDSWASLTVANEYVRLRHIPAGNIVVLSNLSAFDIMDAAHYRSEVLGPVLKAVKDRGLTPQVDCITYSVDLPSAVVVAGDMAGKDFGQTITPVASANGVTYLHRWFMAGDTAYLSLDINRYARRTLPLPKGAPLTPAEQAEYQRGMKLYDAKEYAKAAGVISGLTKVERSDPGLLYNLACCLALAGRGDEAIKALGSAVEAGWRNFGQAASDPDLASIAARADFRGLIQRMKDTVVTVQPTVGFSARTGWNEAGERAESGPSYMLSTVLGVSSGRGNSVGEVLECLRRAAAADQTNPKGTIYIERNGDVRSTTREWAFPFAAEALQGLGVSAVVENGVLPQGREDVMGGVLGAADFSWPACKSTILKGAIVEHLTSCGGMMGERDTQTPCTDLIRAGAAGTSGAVTEPYALQEKFPDPFLHTHYARGATLAEAFYQSLRGPYQLLILGDPLCQPWSPRGHRGGKAGLGGISGPLKGPAALRPSGDSTAWGGVQRHELYVDGKLAQTIKPGASFSLDTTTAPDGEHTLVVVTVHKDPLEPRSRGEFPARFANADRAVKATRKAEAVAFGRTLQVEVVSPGAAGIDLRHLGRTIAHADGDRAVLEVSTAKLGIGRATLTPVALGATPGDRAVGTPIEVEVTAPAPIPAKGGMPAANAPRGLGLSVAGGAMKVVADTTDPAFLAGAGVGPGQAFELRGVFEVDAAVKQDLAQVQVRTNTTLTVEVDGVAVAEVAPDAAGAARWVYAPARLAQGRHILRITGTAGKEPPRIDLRVGVLGTQHPREGAFSAPMKW